VVQIQYFQILLLLEVVWLLVGLQTVVLELQEVQGEAVVLVLHPQVLEVLEQQIKDLLEVQHKQIIHTVVVEVVVLLLLEQPQQEQLIIIHKVELVELE
tara:strand:+ start:272 stop:568 length:297 start_codon:yes stop_codon:yes gene_type:complete